mmetsp:Transcript_97818/g.273851  ORF Transcript_97818/g.273851 Transcript_97818/m.273851 type:complete len:241 (-) Transcript_97818:440-1162(-)
MQVDELDCVIGAILHGQHRVQHGRGVQSGRDPRQDHAERPHVGFLVQSARGGQERLGRHEHHCPLSPSLVVVHRFGEVCARVVEEDGQAEVDEFDAAVGVRAGQHDIVRLQVPMDHASRVDVGHRIQQIPKVLLQPRAEFQALPQRRAGADVVQDVLHGAALAQLHDKEDAVPAVLKPLADHRDARVIQADEGGELLPDRLLLLQALLPAVPNALPSNLLHGEVHLSRRLTGRGAPQAPL